MKQHDFLVFIGRFQPFHKGHLRVVKEGLARAGRLIVLCGSAHQARTLRNPWTFDERKQMLLSSIPAEDRDRVIVAPLMDHLYNDAAWVRSVQTTVNGLVNAYHAKVQQSPHIGLIGYSKDHSSYYLKLFPQWDAVDVPGIQILNATDLRMHMFGRQETVANEVPPSVATFLDAFLASDAGNDLREEHAFIERYQSGWAKAPYPPTFVTVDAVVVQSGHLLLVERSARPGKGLWALPGGFVDQTESLLDACLRELKEETRIKLPVPVLRGAIVNNRVFDDPHRSMRGRTITHAFHLDLPAEDRLPRVRAASDAERAFWLPLGDLDPARCFEDHYFIVQNLIGT